MFRQTLTGNGPGCGTEDDLIPPSAMHRAVDGEKIQ